MIQTINEMEVSLHRSKLIVLDRDMPSGYFMLFFQPVHRCRRYQFMAALKDRNSGPP